MVLKQLEYFTSILALVHLGTSTTMLKTLLASSAKRGMSCMGEMGPLASPENKAKRYQFFKAI